MGEIVFIILRHFYTHKRINTISPILYARSKAKNEWYGDVLFVRCDDDNDDAIVFVEHRVVVFFFFFICC